MKRFLVIEARRLLPLLFLLVLLVSLSIYDNFFRQVEQPVVGTEEEEPQNILTFVTADQGRLDAPASFLVIETMEQWAELQQEHTGLPDYPFNDNFEYAVSVMNGEIRQIRLFPQDDGFVQVQVQVQQEPRVYHVITVERERVGELSRWLFLDEEDRILQEVVITPDQEDEGEEEAEEVTGSKG